MFPLQSSLDAGLESGGQSCLKAEDRAKKQDRLDRAEKEK